MSFIDYFDRLRSILDRVAREQAEPITAAGRLVAGALRGSGVIHVFGSGHSHMIAEEAFYRAGGLAAINPILDARLSFLHGAFESTRAEREEGYASRLLADERIGPGDVAILVSNSGRNAVPVEMALEMVSRGARVIAITNVGQSAGAASRHSSGKRLFELAHVVIDTCVPDGDAVLRLPGLEYPIGPASTVAGAAIMNAIVIEAASELLRGGEEVAVFPSANAGATTEETLLEICRPYAGRIRHLGGNGTPG